MAQGCRNMVLQQLGSYLGHSGRGANPFGKAARDPEWTLRGPAPRRQLMRADFSGDHRTEQLTVFTVES